MQFSCIIEFDWCKIHNLHAVMNISTLNELPEPPYRILKIQCHRI